MISRLVAFKMGNLNSYRRKYQKALETVVYLANKDHRQYWVLKAIYLADKEHLRRYGRQLFSDRYIAMKLGPVPSLAYDIVKSVRDGAAEHFFPEPAPNTALQIVHDNRTVKPTRKANEDLFSASELECINHAHDSIKNLSFEQVKTLTHDAAYDAADQDDEMPITKIIETLDNGAEVLEYRRGG